MAQLKGTCELCGVTDVEFGIALGNPCSGGILIGAAAVAAVHVCLAFIATSVLGRAAD